MEETNESADSLPENHDKFAWNVVNNCKLDPTRVREGRKAEMEYCRKMKIFKRVPIHKVQGFAWTDAGQGQLDRHEQASRGKPQEHQSARRQGLQEVQRSWPLLVNFSRRNAEVRRQQSRKGNSRKARIRNIMANGVARAQHFVSVCGTLRAGERV